MARRRKFTFNQAFQDPDYITISGDIGEPAVAREVVETALSHFGRVDTLINNAGHLAAGRHQQ